MPSALLSSLTSCQAFRASHRLMKPGEPRTTEETEAELQFNKVINVLHKTHASEFHPVYTGCTFVNLMFEFKNKNVSCCWTEHCYSEHEVWVNSPVRGRAGLRVYS